MNTEAGFVVLLKEDIDKLTTAQKHELRCIVQAAEGERIKSGTNLETYYAVCPISKAEQEELIEYEKAFKEFEETQEFKQLEAMKVLVPQIKSIFEMCEIITRGTTVRKFLPSLLEKGSKDDNKTY